MRLKDLYPAVRSEHLINAPGKVLTSKIFFGVEIELEGVESVINSMYWNTTNDGSLRSGYEYKFAQPLWGADIEAALEEFNRYMKFDHPKISERCSVHIHLGAEHFKDVSHLYRFLIIYLALERVLYRSLHPSRENNIYCLPLHTLKSTYSKLSALNSDASAWCIKESLYTEKYISVNTGSLSKLGTIEFRMFHGTYDIKEVMVWLRYLVALVEYSENIENIGGFPELVSNSGAFNWVKEVLGESLAKEFYSTKIERDVMMGVRAAQLAINNEKYLNNSVKYSKRGKIDAFKALAESPLTLKKIQHLETIIPLGE
jgi:hypothetical protein